MSVKPAKFYYLDQFDICYECYYSTDDDCFYSKRMQSCRDKTFKYEPDEVEFYFKKGVWRKVYVKSAK